MLPLWCHLIHSVFMTAFILQALPKITEVFIFNDYWKCVKT